LYKPVRESVLNKQHEIIFPHEDESSTINTKDVIKNSDVVFAEVSFPATGLGIELGWADTYAVPIVCFSKTGAKISGSLKFITKNFIEYVDTEDLVEKTQKFLTSFKLISVANTNEKREIVDIKGNKKQLGCLGCAIQKGEVESPGGSIASTKYFDAHQDYEIPIPGFVILASKRHLQSVDEFTNEEKTDFIEFLSHLRQTMRKACGVQVVYLIQEEDTSHHFHVWMFPRHDWLMERFGRKIQSVRPIMEYARENMKTPKNLQKVDEAMEKMKKYFQKEFAPK